MTLLNEEREKAGITSVLMPLYNHESTVEKALNSILLSDCSRIELIICDDASVDRSFEIALCWITNFGSYFESVHSIRNQTNFGITKNFNKLLLIASGEYITFFASDDELAPLSIDKQSLYLSSNSQKDFVFSNCGYINQQGKIVRSRIVNNWRAFLISRPFWSIFDLVCNWGIIWARLFARRVAFIEMGGYPEQFCFEDRWSALMIAQTKRYGYLDEVVFFIRLRDVGFATGGLHPSILFEDMVGIERLVIKTSTGLLRSLLIIRKNSFNTTEYSNKFRFLWMFLRKMIEYMYRIIILKI